MEHDVHLQSMREQNRSVTPTVRNHPSASASRLAIYVGQIGVAADVQIADSRRLQTVQTLKTVPGTVAVVAASSSAC